MAKCVDAPEVGSPSSWELVVEIEAFPINPADLAMLHGNYGWLAKPPSSIGMEAVGRIVEQGKSVNNFKTGDRVVILANNNWAQRRKVPATLAVKIPESVDPLQAAMLKVNPLTALKLLQQSDQLSPGEFVVQNAPLSNVGRYVLQIAKQLGLKTLNLVRDESQLETVQQLGGDVAVLDNDEVVASITELTGGIPVRLALDGVAGHATNRIAKCLVEGGSIVNFGMLSNEPCLLSPEHTIFRNIQLTGFWLTKVLNKLSSTARTEAITQLANWAAEGKIHGEIDSTFSIEQIGSAIRRSEQRGRNGKVIVLPNGELKTGS
ncbi:MAG: zinc-dependent alcohol dehydrogenase family protein [Pirellulaceae bacterium]